MLPVTRHHCSIFRHWNQHCSKSVKQTLQILSTRKSMNLLTHLWIPLWQATTLHAPTRWQYSAARGNTPQPATARLGLPGRVLTFISKSVTTSSNALRGRESCEVKHGWIECIFFFNKIFIILAVLRRSVWRVPGPSPRFTRATQLRKNVAVVASRCDTVSPLAGPTIESQTSRIDNNVCATTSTFAFKNHLR